MKKYILLLFLGITGTLNAQTKELEVPNVNVYPLRTKWCVPACAECVLRYKKINIDQCKIMKYVQEEAPGYGGFNCCEEIPNFSQHPCNNIVLFSNAKGGLIDILMHFGNIASKIWENSLGTDEIIKNLTNDYPLIVSWDLYDGSNSAHAVVICGIKNGDLIKYMDPNGGGKFDLPWSEFHYDPEHHWWRATLEIIACSSRGDCYPCHCYNFETDGDETGYNCGGSCWACPPPPPPPTGNCTDCVKNNGESEIDCGGKNCPPCTDLPKELTIENKEYYDPYPYDARIRATKKITAKDNTTVKSKGEANYITEEEGSIVLLSGFKVERGGTFRTQMRDLSEYSRICPEWICETGSLDKIVRPRGALGLYDLLYAVKIEYKIYDEQERFVYGETRAITRNGYFPLWNGTPGAIEGTYWLSCSIYFCNGMMISFRYQFVVKGYSKSTEASYTPETPPLFSPPPSNDTPSATATPNFTIIPNPNPGTFQIETNFPLSAIGNLKITNLMGATVYETQNVVSNTVQLPRPTAGTFFVVMILKDGAVLTQKMVVR